MNTHTETETLAICVDCAMLHANGTTEGLDYDREIEVLRGMERYPFLAVGDHDGFSMWGCEACRNNLGGDRFLATVIDWN